MELRLQPKPEVKIPPADKGIVSRKEFFVKKKLEEINQNFLPVHFVRNWKPKAELIYPPASNETAIQYECDFNRNVQNCFVEDYAEEVYLKSPPPCFVVIGKYGKSVGELSSKIAEEFGSVLIRMDDVVTNILKEQTETSKLVQRILRLGVSLTLNFILALLSYVAHTAEARHRGYVLCGLPSLPLSHDLSPDQQFNYLFTWENKPTVFIHVLFDDEDLIKERTNSFIEVVTIGKEKCIKVHFEEEFAQDEDETDEVDELLPIKEETCYERDIDILPSRPWVQLPRNEESQVWSELELFDNIIRPSIELINVRVDPQYFITVDSRVKNEFKLVLARLSLLQIWKAPIAVPFIPLKQDEVRIKNETDEIEEEKKKYITQYDFDVHQIIAEPPQTAFLTLFNVKTCSPKYRWELSHYNYICPVSLREGELVEGKSEFAVFFMKYIYFLRDRKSVLKFIQNPRAYVLPIRPKPLCRFIVLGYPYSGKTTLAKALASEFCIPLIDLNTILKNDSEQKKNIYQEFCRKKAECRETIHLTSLSWQDWRTEEEKRINLIEGWVMYIQSLLRQRIAQFYSAEVDNESLKETQVQVYSSDENSENLQEEPKDAKTDENSIVNHPLELRGTSIYIETSNPRTSERFLNAHLTSPSAKIIHAMKHEDFNFNEKCLEIEANLFFSSLWKSFSCQDRNFISEEETFMEENDENFMDSAESQFTLDQKKSQESVPVDWCSLLPPQSLSTLLINKTSNTTREKRQSFRIFLEAASKAYWVPSALKSEFAKWRLPCFLDIPLCEIFLKNPILLLKYVPDWLKERPLIPEPIDSMHPSVLEAGRKAYFRASVVAVKQNQEEIGILLRDAIEKAEREGMRVTGEVISPGGWVVDNMTLDLKVWNKLACENVLADHVYVLIDTEPSYRRIINLWWNFYGQFEASNQDVSENEDILEENGEEENDEKTEKEEKAEECSRSLNDISRLEKRGTIIKLLIDSANAIIKEEDEIDEIYEALRDGSTDYKLTLSEDVFCREFLRNTVEALTNINDDLIQEETLLNVQILTGAFSSTSSFFPSQLDNNIPLGVKLEFFTEAVLNYFKEKTVEDEKEIGYNKPMTNGLEFFLSLLTISEKLEQLKEWMTSIGRDFTIQEIEMTGKTCDEIFSEIRKNLMEPFIKKPRELESFEMEEIKKFNVQKSSKIQLKEEDLQNENVRLKEKAEEEDPQIFGESGPLCIVNLERDIFLRGNFEFALRYYGKLYYFWNQAAKNKFIENPEKYAPYYSAIRCYPPLRVFVVGPVGCGKTKLIKSLANHFSVFMVDYSEFMTKSLLPHVNTMNRKFNAITNQKLLVSEEHNTSAKTAKQNFNNAPYEKRQFWLESPFYLDFIGSKKFRNKMINITEPMTIKTASLMKYAAKEKLNGEDETDLLTNLPETSYVSMEKIETIIFNYLRNNTDLTDYCINKSFKILWTEEPYITQGFALEGFPLRFSDITHIIENNWIPDLVIEISLPEYDVVERNIDDLMELWNTKLKQETHEEKLMEDTLISLRNVLISLRRNELVNQRRDEAKQKLILEADKKEKEKPDISENENLSRQFKADVDDLKDNLLKSRKSLLKKPEFREISSTEKSFGLSEDMEQEIQEDVEKTLKEEFPSMIFNSIFETYDAGKSRITENLLQTYKRDVEEINKIRAALKEQDVSWLEIDGLRNEKQILKDLFLRLDKVKKRSAVRGEFSFTMTMEMAEILLLQGFYFLSKFGRWCPVQLYQKKNPIHMFRPFSAKKKVTPIAYRNYIYFVAGENEKIKFINDPIKYIFTEPHFPNIPIRIAIIGPPKSGKSILSKRLGMMFDLKVVTMGSALRFVLEKAPQSTLSKLINSHLRRGSFLPLSLKVEALMVSLNDPSCVTQGFIFDGIPFDAALTQSLAEKRKLPFVIISLVADSCFGKANRQNLDVKEFRLPYKNRSNIESRYKDWKSTYKRFAQWNRNSYNNLYEVNAKLNVVNIFYQAYDIIRNSTLGIFYYVEYCVSDRVLPLHYLCVSQHEYDLRKSPFHNNCPVCWSKLSRLSNCTNPPPRSGLVQYLNLFYWICPKHREEFTKNPKLYFPPHASQFPEFLPERLNKSTLKKRLVQLKIHGFGRCPVTRVDFPNNLNWEGSHDFAACYMNEVFLFRNEKMLDRFLKQPWRYCKADTQFEVNSKAKSKAVEQLGPLQINSLPPIGFLEQTVADLIHECLQVLGIVRPLYPSMTPTVTGCIFVALYLKVHNKKSRNVFLERHYLNIMYQNCKARGFVISPLKPLEDKFKMKPEDYESPKKVESESSSEESMHSKQSSHDVIKNKTLEPYWLDYEFQVERNIWSARNVNHNFFEMKLISGNELVEIPEIPKIHAILKYPKYGLRPSPIPPVSNCLTVLYSSKKNVQIPETFNYKSLYQPVSLTSSPVSPSIQFNPNKQFSMTLHKTSRSGFISRCNLHNAQSNLSDSSSDDFKLKTNVDINMEMMLEPLVPRFQLLDKVPIPKTPQVPKVVENEPFAFIPPGDYTYILLFSEFFHATHVLRCYEWDEIRHHFEFSNRLDKNLGLTNVKVDYILEPRRTDSMKSRTSVKSYQRIFDAATTFAFRSDISESKNKNEDQTSDQKSSLVNFIQLCILEKLEEIFDRVSTSTLSYDAYDMSILSSSQEDTDHPTIAIQEILPYPPLSWDIVSRPYYAYISSHSAFETPPMDNIAHQRHVSLLDGIEDTRNELRFISYSIRDTPQSVQMKECESKELKICGFTPFYFVYDFFNLPWTSFLVYQFSWAFRSDFINCAYDAN